MECSFCSKSCLTASSHRNHERCCPSNPNRNYKNGMIGKKGSNQYIKARKLGLPDPVLSEETRKKLGIAGANKKLTDQQKERLSEIKRDFLKKNPEKVPYRLNHSSKGPSYPEKYWGDILLNNGINFTPEHPIGPYQLDFAILNKKIDLEIDGEQHYVDPRIVKSDIRREEYLKSFGWRIIRIRWKDYLRLDNKEEYVRLILETLTMDD